MSSSSARYQQPIWLPEKLRGGQWADVNRRKEKEKKNVSLVPARDVSSPLANAYTNSNESELSIVTQVLQLISHEVTRMYMLEPIKDLTKTLSSPLSINIFSP
jgi:hypothetical protein